MFHVNLFLETDLLMDFYCVSLVISAVLCHLISVCLRSFNFRYSEL